VAVRKPVFKDLVHYARFIEKPIVGAIRSGPFLMLERNDLRRPAVRPTTDILFLGALFAFLSLFHEIYVDDAFITLSYARTFAESGVWGMHAPFVSNAATSPLNVLLLSGLIKLGLPGTWAAYVLECLLATAIFFTLSFISLRVFGLRLWAYVATLALFTNPLLVSTAGLETYLFIAVLVGCCAAYILERYLLLGLAAGFLVLARPDGVLLLLPLFALMVFEKRATKVFWVLLGFGTVVGLWGFISWLYLGSAIPDTYFIKRREAGWHGFSFANGLAIYDSVYPLATLLSLALLVFVPFGFTKTRANRPWRPVVVLVGGLALIQYIVYSLLNLPPYHWYYGIFVGAVVLIGSAGLISLRDRFPRCTVFGFAAAVILGGAATCAEAALVREQMPIHTNLGTVAQYRGIADWLNDHTSMKEYQMIGELGVIQYYGRADAVNNFSDRAILRDVVNRLPDGSVRKWIADVNFAHLAVRPPAQSGYLLEENCTDSAGAVKTWTTSSTWIKSIVWCLKREK
jgi:hypothetical protein